MQEKHLYNNQVYSLQSKYVAIYHVGHYGFFLKFLIHKLHYYKDKKTLLLIDTGTMSIETYCFIQRNQEKLEKLFDVIIYNDLTYFCYESDEEELKHKIINFFDQIFIKFNTFIDSDTEIYSGFDGRSAFGAYLTLNKIPYSLCDLAAFSLKPGRTIYVKTKGDLIYATLMKKLNTMYYQNPFVNEIIWTKLDNIHDIGKNSMYVDFTKMLANLSKVDLNYLLNLFEINSIQFSHQEYVLLVCNSTGVLVWNSITKKEYFGLYHSLLNSISNTELGTLIKCHPNYEFSEIERLREFPSADYIPGYVPFELIPYIPNLKIKYLISSGSTASILENIKGYNFSIDSFKYVYELNQMIFILNLINYLEVELEIQMDLQKSQFISDLSSILSLNCNKSDYSDKAILFDKEYSKTFQNGFYLSIGLPKEDCLKCILKNNAFAAFFSTNRNLKKDLPPVLVIGNEQILKKTTTYIEMWNNKNDFVKIYKGSVEEAIALNEISEFNIKNYELCTSAKSTPEHNLMSLIRSNPTGQLDYEICDYISKNKIDNWSGYLLGILTKHSAEEDALIRLAEFYSKQTTSYSKAIAKQYYLQLICSNTGYYPKYISFLLTNPEYYKEAYSICNTDKTKYAPYLARMYKDGLYVKPNFKTACKFYEEAIKHNTSFVGEYADLLIRMGNTNNYESAYQICMLVADKDAGAMIRVARMLKNGHGVEKNLFQAIEYYKMGVCRGAKWAATEWYDLLWSMKSESFDKALYDILCIQKETDDPRIIGRLARMYHTGRYVEKNLLKSKEMLEPISEKSPYWNNELVDVLIDLGDEASFKLAFEYAQRFAEIDSGAMKRLAFMYKNGLGVKKDLNKSIKWSSMAKSAK